ncbi:MAG: metallophosphoesterase [Rikenellaceae bacterium]|nr:metallophosphoesterase [Rikenellaceae bacterium]
MIWILLVCSLVMLWIDRRAINSFDISVAARRRWLAALWLTDILPFLVMAFALLLRDNPTWLSVTMLWAVWAYVVLSIARFPTMAAVAFFRRNWVRVMGAAVSVLAVVIFVYGMAVTRTDYEVRRVVIESEKVPESFDGYKIVQISDMHVGNMVCQQRELNEIISICNGLEADAIAFTGDLVDIRYSELSDDVLERLARLKARDGIYSVTGNHDIGVYVKDSISLPPAVSVQKVIEVQRKIGWRVLEDETIHLRRGKDSISLTGISFSPVLQEFRHSAKIPDVAIEKAYDGMAEGGFNVTLVHIPQLWDVIVSKQLADLTLSGHVHAMQMKLPIGKRGISPSRVKYRRWSGLYEEGGRWLYINDGVGYVLYPMRIGARPEITLFELRRR